MKGLIYKDLCLLGSVWKSYAFILVMFSALTVTGVYDVSFLFMMVSVILCMYPSTSFSYDELAKWDRFAVSVPSGRVLVVRAKYGFALLLGAASLVFDLLLSLLAAFLGRMEPGNGLLTCVGGVAGALLINALMLPLLFRFGAQKGRILLIAVVAALAGVLGALLAIGGMTAFGSGLLKSFVLVVLPVLALLALFVSYRISLGIYQKKEF